MDLIVGIRVGVSVGGDWMGVGIGVCVGGDIVGEVGVWVGDGVLMGLFNNVG